MAILFDRLVFFPIGLGPIGTPDAIFTKERILANWLGRDVDALADLDKMVMLDHELIQDIDQFYHSLMFTEHDDLWTGESSQAFIEFVKQYVDEKYPKDTPGERWELYKTHIGCINSDYRLCQIINRDFDDCSALLTELHERAVLETLRRKPPSSAERISTVIGNLNSFDFGTLSWADIFTLRNSGFVDDYRKQVADWVLAHTGDGSTEGVTQSLEKFIQDSVFELIGATEPRVRETILSGIGGNLPSPVGLNPISVFSAIRDAKNAHSLKSKFGWLYFVQRGRAAAKRGAK